MAEIKHTEACLVFMVGCNPQTTHFKIIPYLWNKRYRGKSLSDLFCTHSHWSQSRQRDLWHHKYYRILLWHVLCFYQQKSLPLRKDPNICEEASLRFVWIVSLSSYSSWLATTNPSSEAGLDTLKSAPTCGCAAHICNIGHFHNYVAT